MTFDTGFDAEICGTLNINVGDDMPDDIHALAAAIMSDTNRISEIFDSRPTEYIYLVLATYLGAYQKATGKNLAWIIADGLEACEFPLEPMEEYPEC